MKLLAYLFAFTAFVCAEDTDLEKLLHDANNQFTAKVFAETVKEHPNESVVLSAFSILPPLAQLSVASAGNTHDELLKAIGFANDNVTKEVFPVVTGQLRSVKGVDLRMASKIYIPINYQLNEEFQKVSRDLFQSEVQNVDFTKSDATASEINKWVEEQTNHRIKDLVDPQKLDSTTRTVLVNALYFKGSWKNKFSNYSTTNRDFHVSKTKTIQTPMMFQKDDFRYGESSELDCKMLEMFYEGEESSMVILLPNDVEGLPALIEKLKNPALLEEAEKKLYQTEIEVYIPKFKIETTTNLKTVLSNIGIKSIFDPSASDLHKLLKSDEDLYVSDAIQKAFIEVNEEGAEAAAANEFGIAYLSAVVSPSIIFKADHPFVFLLKERNNVLFSGIFHP